MTTEQYLRQAIESFRNDPADSQFQRGYLAALVEMAKVLCPSLDIPENLEN